jgi:hypothetical protein
MGKASGLFLAAAGAASLIVACVIPWQDSANVVVSPPPQGDISITPAGETTPGAIVASGQAVLRAGRSPAADEPAPPPELATLAPRTALGPPQKEGPLPPDRIWLGRELQRELVRVGCYEGELNGIWTPAARKAMKAFTDRVNAALPTDEPDYILLALVQGYRDKVCGMTCPAGEGLSEGGRCVPNAILAAKKPPQITRAVPFRADPAPASTGWSVTRAPAPAAPLPSPDEGRMGLAGPLAPKNPALVDGPVPVAAAALDAPAQSVPVPTSAHGASRRATARPTNFNPTSFFKQLGF